MVEGAFLLVFVLLSLGSGLVLYWLVRGEGSGGEAMTREDAERVARRDTEE